MKFWSFDLEKLPNFLETGNCLLPVLHIMSLNVSAFDITILAENEKFYLHAGNNLTNAPCLLRTTVACSIGECTVFNIMRQNILKYIVETFFFRHTFSFWSLEKGNVFLEKVSLCYLVKCGKC